MTSTLDFTTVFSLELGYVLRTLRRLGVRDADVEDVGHDVFLAVFASFHDLDPDRPIRPWLFGFAFRFASNYRRKLKPADEIDDSSALASSGPLADEALAREGDRRLVLAALERIPLARRGVFVMFEIDGVPVVEIARVLEIPEGTAHSRLHKARAEFREAVSVLERKERDGNPARTAS